MHILLLFAGLVALIVGGLMATAGYFNFDFSYGGTLVITAAIIVMGGLLLIGAGAVISQLRRIHRTLSGAQTVNSQVLGSAPADDITGESPRPPVLPPRQVRDGAGLRPHDAGMRHHTEGPASAEPHLLEGANPGSEDDRPVSVRQPEPAEWPRVSPADRLAEARGERKGANGSGDDEVRVSGSPREDISPTNTRSPPAILKSGVIEGMAYTLYSDGSVEAELPQGLMRFASVGEWREYLTSQA
ncbi:MAG: hypothetical protein QOD74_1866 [Variibacter sp.]|jgi:hypothetical protein|nr:hypothetical protein [Variibacter sp.]